jgi:hypothetical protein
MDEWKRPARGFDEISSVFLSSNKSDPSAETASHPSPANPGSPFLLPVLCCLSPTPAVEAFFTCNLSVEIAKNNHTVTLIDFGFERSIVRRYLRCTNPVQDILPATITVYPDYRIESMRFDGLPEITLISPAMPRQRDFPERTLERIFAEDKVRRSSVILITSPMGSDEVEVPDLHMSFQRAIIFMDDQAHSLVKAYSLIKRLSSVCRYYLIGAVSRGEDVGPVQQNVSKLQKTIFKHLPEGLELRVVSMSLDQGARISMQSARPLVLRTASTPSSSAEAIARLCRNILREE